MLDNNKTGGPAFPTEVVNTNDGWIHSGMTLRDYFAAKAMNGMLAGHIGHYGHDNYWPYEDMAKQSYQMADAMLVAREDSKRSGV